MLSRVSSVSLPDERRGVGSAAAGRRDVDVLRNRVHRNIINKDVARHDADQGGELFVDPLDIDLRGRGGRAVAGFDRGNGAADRVADKQHAVRTERKRAGRLEPGIAAREVARRRYLRRARRIYRDDERESENTHLQITHKPSKTDEQ